MSYVYVCHHDGLREDPLDISDAERFGSLRMVLGREIFPDNADDVVPESIERAFNILSSFNPDEDYLLLVGSPLHIAICAAIVSSRSPRFRVLRYDRINTGYYSIEIDRSKKRLASIVRSELQPREEPKNAKGRLEAV